MKTEELSEEQSDYIVDTVISLCQGPKEPQAMAMIMYAIVKRLRDIGVSRDVFLETLKELWGIEV